MEKYPAQQVTGSAVHTKWTTTSQAMREKALTMHVPTPQIERKCFTMQTCYFKLNCDLCDYAAVTLF